MGLLLDEHVSVSENSRPVRRVARAREAACVSCLSQQFASFWHGGPLPPHCWFCLKTFVDHGHAVTLYSYDELRVPGGVTNADAATILPASAIFHQTHRGIAGRISAFTDLFRFKLLLDRGGWWIDTDVLCLRPDVPERPLAIGWEIKEHVVGTAVMKLPPQHWFAAKLYASAQELVRAKGAGAKLAWAEIGPTLLTRLTHETGLAPELEPHHRFYPVGWHDYQVVMQPEQAAKVEARLCDSVFVHLWTEMYRRDRIDPAEAPPGSWLAMMFARHGCEGLLAPPAVTRGTV
jgi:mannosyltransferase OCH1-like enzyme